MTDQQKIEALSGTIYDYDDVCDNLPDYFDYNDPYDYEEFIVLMVRWKVKCVMTLADRMLLVARLSSPKIGLVTGQLALGSRLETDSPQ